MIRAIVNIRHAMVSTLRILTFSVLLQIKITRHGTHQLEIIRTLMQHLLHARHCSKISSVLSHFIFIRIQWWRYSDWRVNWVTQRLNRLPQIRGSLGYSQGNKSRHSSFWIYVLNYRSLLSIICQVQWTDLKTLADFIPLSLPAINRELYHILGWKNEKNSKVIRIISSSILQKL